jgi:hypothetical protein
MDKKTVSSTEYFKNDLNKIDEYNFANFLNVVDIDKKSYFNITKTVNFINVDKISPNGFMSYQIL